MVVIVVVVLCCLCICICIISLLITESNESINPFVRFHECTTIVVVVPIHHLLRGSWRVCKFISINVFVVPYLRRQTLFCGMTHILNFLDDSHHIHKYQYLFCAPYRSIMLSVMSYFIVTTTPPCGGPYIFMQFHWYHHPKWADQFAHCLSSSFLNTPLGWRRGV